MDDTIDEEPTIEEENQEPEAPTQEPESPEETTIPDREPEEEEIVSLPPIIIDPVSPPQKPF